MSQEIILPTPDGALLPYRPGAPSEFAVPTEPIRSRIAYAAAHVVCNPLADIDPLSESSLDWDATLAYRRYLWSYGFAVAEAMDTAQRGMGLDWTTSKELIRRSLSEARAVAGAIACGAGTDHLPPHEVQTLAEVRQAYEEQCGFVEREGGRVILMASRALARSARCPDDYLHVYGQILSQVSQPVILHWLGDIFDPSLASYWGTPDSDQAMAVCLTLIRDYRKSTDGIKISLLDPEREIEMRRSLPDGVRMYTGNDLSYDRLIRGDEHGFSHALLGIFDAIAPAAATALKALDAGNVEQYQQILAPTVLLSRHIFQPPTYFYKTGIVFLAYLNGHQSHYRMVGEFESARSVVHLAELFRLADQARLLVDPDRATERMRHVLALAGIN